MSLLTPAAFWLGLTLPAILVLYLLKRRYQDQTVSSTYLWRQALRDLEASSPWQKLRRHLLLYLQLAAAALLVLAAVRPALLTRAPSGDVIVVLDASASMQATDVAPSRFEVARSRARALIEGLGRGDRLTLVTAAARPKVLAVASRDRAELLRALGEAQVTSETADLEEALQTALASLQGRSGQTPSVTAVVISDGRVAPGSRPNWPMAIRYERVGEDAGNLAVLAFSLALPEPPPSGSAVGAARGPTAPPPGLTGLVRVANYGPNPAEAVLDLLANGQVVATRSLRLAAGGEQDLTFADLPLEPSYLARIQPAPGTHAPGGAAAGGAALGGAAAADALAVDNVAYAVSPSADRARALLVTSGNRFLERAMSLFPSLEVYRAAPEEYAVLTEPEAYALVVFDGYLPDRLPATNLWVLNPPRDNVLAVSASRPVAGLEAADPSDPLLRYV
ncbi:MAG: vWA domain-containing protein, partial [Bacillota bacterium]